MTFSLFKNINEAVGNKKPVKRFSENFLKVLLYAGRIAVLDKRNKITPQDIMGGLFLNKTCLATELLLKAGVDIKKNLARLVPFSRTDLRKVKESQLKNVLIDPKFNKLILDVYSQAKEVEAIYVGTEHLLLIILKLEKKSFVKDLGNKVNYKLIHEMVTRLTANPFSFLKNPGVVQTLGGESALEYFGLDMVQVAKSQKMTNLVDRPAEVDQLVKTLIRREKHNPLLVGPSGVGKTSLVSVLANRIAVGDVPLGLKNNRIVMIKNTLLLSGGRGQGGEIEKKFLAILKEAEMRSEVILFFDDIHTLFGTPLRGGMSLEEVIKPVLSKGRVRAIGTVTNEHFKATIEGDAALMRRFKVINVTEPSVEECLVIMKGLVNSFEAHHKIMIKDKALELAVKLSDLYISDRYLPDKAIDLIDEACASRRIHHDKKYENVSEISNELELLINKKDDAVYKGSFKEAQKIQTAEKVLQAKLSKLEKQKYNAKNLKQFAVDVNSIREVVAEWTGIPITTLSSGERSNLLHLDRKISRHIISQKDAVQRVSYAVKRGRIGITDKNRPWASFLFLGPTGVGKTELAKVLSKILFGSKSQLIQIDMSELMEMHSISKLIGSPPGYIGYEQGGWLTEQVRKNPHSVVLFDEIEKAHPDVLNILLQILEDGQLTDGRGNRINFANTIIIMTSNIGAEKISEDKVLGFAPRHEKSVKNDEESYSSMKHDLHKELKKRLRPELLNRLDDIVIFRGITRIDARLILDLLMEELNRRLRSVNIIVELDRKAKNVLLENGYSEEYGARPLRREILHEVEDIIADYILSFREKKDGFITYVIRLTRNKQTNERHKLQIEEVMEFAHEQR